MANIINSVITVNKDFIGTLPNGKFLYSQEILPSVFCQYEIWCYSNEETGLASDFCKYNAVFNTFEEAYVEAHKIADMTDLLKEGYSLTIEHSVGIRLPDGTSKTHSEIIISILGEGRVKLVNEDLQGLCKEILKKELTNIK